MRYIRTKNRVWEFGKDFSIIDNHLMMSWQHCSIEDDMGEIIAQADTIEELIDCLTKKEPKHKHPELLAGKPNMYLKDERALKYMTKRIKNKTIIISGCIWVGDDLIKVSELNEKGELELI